MRGCGVRGGLAALAFSCLSAPGLAAPDDAKPAAPTSEAKREAKAEPAPLTREAINAASFAAEEAAPAGKPENRKSDKKAEEKRPDALLVKAQVLLDRARFSPGAIDGLDGENLKGALSAFAVAQGLPATKTLTQEVFDKLQATSADPVAVEYAITEADVAGPFVDKMPAKMEQQAELDSMGYTTAREMLAERFHMSRDLLSALNPDKPLDRAGTVITVAGVPAMATGKPKPELKPGSKAQTKGKKREAEDGPGKDVARIEIDKETKQLRAFDKAGKLVAFYPASIGSDEKPAPSGEATVKGVAFEPWYTYNPKYAFKGVKAKSKFSIHPGPNNPVGLVWIDLSIPSYGIHGTPEPEKVGKTESHGCIRLTNWDARDLASRVRRGAPVAFKDE